MSSRKTNWTEEEEKRLFELHMELGNKWSSIAVRMGDKDDSCIKNKFYSTLRKGLRKINNYVVNVKKKTDPIKFKAFKSLPELFLTKVIAVVDRNYDQKFQVKAKAIELASNIQARIVEVACSATEYLKPQITDYSSEEALLTDIQEFNKNCKKRKGKRKLAAEKEKWTDNDQNLPYRTNNQEESVEEDSSSEFNSNFHKQDPKHKKTLEKAEIQPTTIVQNSKAEEKVEEEPVNIFSSWSVDRGVTDNSIIANQKATIRTTAIENTSKGFANKAEEFFRAVDDNPLTQSGNLSLSNSWMYDSSCDPSKKSHYLFQPSPLPSSDAYSPFSFTNLMKNNNITLSSQMDDRYTGSIDLFASGKFYQTKREENVLSLVDQLPQYEVSSANCLVRSADLLRSIDLIPKTSSTSCKDTLPATPFDPNLESSTLNQFLKAMNFMGSADDRINEYSFGSNGTYIKPGEE